MLNLVTVRYKNHKGEESIRNILPISLWFGSTAWHREPQWLLHCFDLDKQATRDYAMSGILGEWKTKE